MDSKWFFIHLIATCLPVFIDYALNTSENVPSPFLEIKRYSKKLQIRRGVSFHYYALEIKL
jgi:hypothetical protein